MSVKLYSHQVKAIEQAWPILEENGIVLLSMMMRTGKTLCALTLAEKVGGNVLFVTKAKAIDGIWSDWAKFSSDSTRMGLEVVSYDSLHKVDSERFSCVICDECHVYSSFPKLSLRAKRLRAIFNFSGAKAILLSGTPSVESICQTYHMLRSTGRGPWMKYRGAGNGFYQWFKVYGKLKKIRIAGGREVNDYSHADYEKVMEHISPLTVTMTQKEAGFTQEAKVNLHTIKNQKLALLIAKFKKDAHVEINGADIVGEGPAAVLQKMHMMAGGTVLDDEQMPVRLTLYDCEYRIRYICEKAVAGRRYAIFTAYIEERNLIMDFLVKKGFSATTKMEDFKAGEQQYFVGSLASYAEGFDLAWLDGAVILYSLVWSGAKFLQIIQRMANKKRVDPIQVHVMMLEGGIDDMVYQAVSKKKNFNKRFYLDAGGAIR